MNPRETYRRARAKSNPSLAVRPPRAVIAGTWHCLLVGFAAANAVAGVLFVIVFAIHLVFNA